MNRDDMELVREYALRKSEAAFATLVSRHVDLVYSVALRKVRDRQLAEEITQTVFIILARKAGSLGRSTVVSGWLCRTAHYASLKAITMQRRRQDREQQAYMQSQLNETEADTWSQIAPVLDGAMARLGQKDYDALSLRFFDGHNFKDVSAKLGTTEAGAKMRVNRALEKLRKIFAGRGLTVSAAAIATMISAHSVQAAPVGLATSVAATAVQGTLVTASTLNLINTTLKLMAWTKLKTITAAGAIALLLVGGATVAIRHRPTPEAKIPGAFAFAGYGTPEATIQSVLWAASQGDVEGFMAGFTPQERERFKNRTLAGKSSDQVRQKAIALAHSLEGYIVTQTEVKSPVEVHLHISAPSSPEGLPGGKTILILKKIGNEWKRDGDLD
jgi:RNA polymerase sigma factor (sigma-70 family)